MDERIKISRAVANGELPSIFKSAEIRGVNRAREAVYRTCGHTKYEGCSPCAHDDAAAAIDALILNDAVETLGAVFK